MRPAFELVTAPTVEPLSIDQVKEHCRLIDDTVEDDEITRLIASARRHVESTYGLALLTQTHKVTLDAIPVKGIGLRPHPIQSVTTVKSWDGSAFATLTASDFQLLPGRPATLVLADSATAPSPSRTRAGIEITFDAGFGDAADDIPEDVRQALLMLVGHWYENREAVVVGARETKVTSELSRGVGDLLFPYLPMRLSL